MAYSGITSLFNLRANGQAIAEALALIKRERRLLMALSRAELSERYAGEVFGLLWAIGQPLFMAGLYVVIFTFVFRAKIGGTLDLPLDYTAYILSGLISWLGFQDAMTRSSTVLISSAQIIKQGVYRSELMPVKIIVTSLISQAVMLVVLIAYVLFNNGALHLTYLLLPVLVGLQLLAMIGVGFLLSAVTVFFRDMKDFITLFVMAGPFLIPAFFLPEWVPDALMPVLYANPFSYMVWCYQDALYYGRIDHPWAWFMFTALSFSIFALGYRTFRKLQPLFGNVL